TCRRRRRATRRRCGRWCCPKAASPSSSGSCASAGAGNRSSSRTGSTSRRSTTTGRRGSSEPTDRLHKRDPAQLRPNVAPIAALVRSSERRTLLAAFLLGLLAFASGCSTARFEGWRAYERGDYPGAYREWRPLAEDGDPSAQYLVGLMFDEGQGVDANPAEAF